MKINGLKHLNSNFYDSIMIRDRGLELKVDVKNDNGVDTIKISPSFYDGLRDLSDKEKVSEIVRYFLRNNKIKYLDDRCYVLRYKGHFLKVGGSRDLFLQLSSDNVEKGLVKEIINKYVVDRNEFLFKNQDIRNIEIFYGGNCPSYKVKEDILTIRLMSEGRKLCAFERNFLDWFIKQKIDNTTERIDACAQNYIYVATTRFGNNSGYYFKCDDFIISVDKDFYDRFYECIEKHNKTIIDSKKLQLTFYDYNN